MSRVVVTGSGGFIGAALSAQLKSMGREVVPIARELIAPHQRHSGSSSVESAMHGAQAVIHLAARAHVVVERHSDPLGEYRKINLAGTIAVAEAAVRARVRRFVYVSSIGVLGNASGDHVFSEADAPSPCEPYAISKWDAERALRSLEEKFPLEVAIVRPPLVYGPHVKGNFHRLLRLLASGVPLPLGSVQNQRSYIGLDNLCDFLILCAFHPAAKGRLFLIADGEDISTPELLRMLASAMGKRARVFRCPLPLLSVAATVLGKQAELQRLTSNLRVDAGAARTELGWNPNKNLRAGMLDMVRWFMNESHL